MYLSETQANIVKDVLSRFLEKREATPKHFLVVKYGDPEALDWLVRANVLECLNHQSQGQQFLPRVLAFHCCADEEPLREAKRSVEVVASVLKSLYTKDLEKERTNFPVSEVETCGLELYKDIRPETIKLGLYLIREFSEIGCGANMNPEGLGCSIAFVYQHIVRVKSFGTVWDDHILRCDPPPDAKSESKLNEDPNILLSALRRVCNDAEFDDLLINAPNKKPHKLKVSAAFEARVGWLLSLFGFSTIVLGEYERIVAPDTEVEKASVDILAAHQIRQSLLLVACTLSSPKPEDFNNLRHARELFSREVFAGKSVQVIPVVFTAAVGCAPYQTNEGTLDRVPIIDGDGLKEILELLRTGKETELLDFFSNRIALSSFDLNAWPL